MGNAIAGNNNRNDLRDRKDVLPRLEGRIDFPKNVIQSDIIVHRDEIGVPHVYATNSLDLYTAGMCNHLYFLIFNLFSLFFEFIF